MDRAIRILLNDDDMAQIELNEHELRKQGILFTSARVAAREDFCRALKDFRPDLVLTDYRLAGFDGMTALRLVQELRPGIPVIIVTGSLNEETAADTIKAGAADYIIKQRLARLGPAVRGALEKKKNRDEKEQAQRSLKAAYEQLREKTSELQNAVAALKSEIEKRKEYEQQLRDSKIYAESIVKTVRSPLVILDVDLRIVSANDAFYHFFGLSEEETRDQLLSELGDRQWDIPELNGFLCDVIHRDAPVENCEIFGTFREAGFRVLLINVRKITRPEARQSLVLLSIEDITERRQKEENIKYVSYHDEVTGLYNWTFFKEELKRLDTGRELPISIIIGDVNNLKLTNDAFGHQEGDKLLRKIAELMKIACRNEDIIARWGGDEFVILLPKTEYATAVRIAERINKMCRESTETVIRPSIALGVSSKDRHDADIMGIMRQAEEKMYKKKVLENKENQDALIAALQEKLTQAGIETKNHIERVQNLSARVGREVGLSDSQLNELVLLSALHDIGKSSVPEHILLKQTSLSPQEWDAIQKHSEAGFRIVHAFPGLSSVAEQILVHHENYDGTGYPKGLKNDEIPFIVRILTIIDAYDVMTHERPYGRILSHAEALVELRKGAGRQFDPDLVEVLIRGIERSLEDLAMVR